MGNSQATRILDDERSRISADETIAFAATYVHRLTQDRTSQRRSCMSRDDFELLSQKSLESKLSLFGGEKKRRRPHFTIPAAMSCQVNIPKTSGTETEFSRPSPTPRPAFKSRMKTSMSNPQFRSSPQVRVAEARFLTPPVVLPRYGALSSPHNASLRKKRLCGLFTLPDGARTGLMQRHVELLRTENCAVDDVCSYWSLCCLIRRVLRFTHAEGLVVALILLERLRQKKVAILPSNRCLHVFIAALLAYKYLDDCPYDNATWAKYVGLDAWTTKSVNIYEVVFLQRLQWQLSVSRLEYVDFVGRALKQVLGPAADLRGAHPEVLQADHDHSLAELEDGLRALIEVVQLTNSCRTRLSPVAKPPPAMFAPPSIV
eukprot:Rmarinus@m.23545